jgi:hypothetical protein
MPRSFKKPKALVAGGVLMAAALLVVSAASAVKGVRAGLFIAACASLLAVTAGCDRTVGGEDSSDLPASPLESSAFLTPVAQVREAEIETYWLGEEFTAGSLAYRSPTTVDLVDEDDPEEGIAMFYSADVGKGFATLSFRLRSRSLSALRLQLPG